jgi:hypothetical protein
MSEKDLPAIPELTQAQLNRLLCADWLESIATLIRRGQVNGFNLAWDERVGKPEGPVQISANLLKSPLELKLLAQIAQEEQAPKPEIIYQDMTEKLKDHDCKDPQCIVCNPPHEA